MSGQRVGYARVSSQGQSLDVQLEKLAGCDKIFSEKASGSGQRVELERLLDYVRDGDTVVVSRLDRLARSVLDLVSISDRLESMNVGLVVLDQQLESTSAAGRLLFHVLGAIGEFERDLIRERARDGIEQAKAKGVQFGRPGVVAEKELPALLAEFEANTESRSDLAKKYGVSRATLYRLVKKARSERASSRP